MAKVAALTAILNGFAAAWSNERRAVIQEGDLRRRHRHYAVVKSGHDAPVVVGRHLRTDDLGSFCQTLRLGARRSSVNAEEQGGGSFGALLKPV